MQLGIELDGLPVTFGGYDRSTQWIQYQRALCEATSAQSSTFLSVQAQVSTVNDQVGNAWGICMAQQGVHFWAEATAGGATVTLVAVYNPVEVPLEANASPISWSPRTALNCESTRIGHVRGEERFLNHQPTRVVCTRASRNDGMPAVVVSLKTSAGDREVRLPSVFFRED